MVLWHLLQRLNGWAAIQLCEPRPGWRLNVKPHGMARHVDVFHPLPDWMLRVESFGEDRYVLLMNENERLSRESMDLIK
jgi:hypothetical protein